MVTVSLERCNTETEKVSQIIGVEPNTSNPDWEYEVIKEEGNSPFDFIDFFLSLLDGKYENLGAANISLDDISIWVLYEYEGQCNMEFSPIQLKKNRNSWHFVMYIVLGSKLTSKFSYDNLNRMTTGTYGEGTSISTNIGRFSENITSYDKNGNIKSLQRYSKTNSITYRTIDNLTLEYITLLSSAPTYHYYLKDHLGNNRNETS